MLRTEWRRRAFAVFASMAVVVTGLVVPATSAAAADPADVVKINEVNSSGTDWVELFNTGSAAVDLGGYIFKDNDDTHSYAIPAGTTISAGGYYVLNTGDGTTGFDFGLGGGDSARLFAPDGTTLIDGTTWSGAAATWGRCANGTGDFVAMIATQGAVNDCPAVATDTVKINEVNSSGTDWVEFINNGATAVDLSGYIFKDNDDSHSYTIPAGTTIDAGGYLVLISGDGTNNSFDFGLGGGDSARLFAPDGTTLLDSTTWPGTAATWGRCANGTGDFVAMTATQGAVNDCAAPTTTTTTEPPSGATPWPGGPDVQTVDTQNFFGTNMSGLMYQGSGSATPGVLWAVKNGPGTLYKLVWDGGKWVTETSDGWSAGKVLHFADGTGDTDSEGVTFADQNPDGGIFVSTERDNTNNQVSRLTILRFDSAGSATSLTATNEWNLTADLPVVGPNLGLEALTWVPDSQLTGKGFFDEHTGAAYDPSVYANHGDGLFFVGVEGTGMIYAYALDLTGNTYTRVASITSAFPAVMELQFDPESSLLWAVCDDTCQGQSEVLDVDSTGHFVQTVIYDRPAGMPNLNNEGFAITPDSECVDGLKPVFWSDDNEDDGHALRAGTLDCTVPDGPTTSSSTPESSTSGSSTSASPTSSATVTSTPVTSSTSSGPVVPITTITTTTSTTSTTSKPTGPALAATGVSSGTQATIAVIALVLGAALVLIGRRHWSPRQH